MKNKEIKVQNNHETSTFSKLNLISSFIEWKHNTNYLIYQNGKIYSKKSNKYLKGFITRDGYLRYYLYDTKGKVNSYLAHRLIYMSFLKYEEGMFIIHLDNDKMNNNINNLGYIYQNDLNQKIKNLKKEQKSIENIIEEKSKTINMELSPMVKNIIKSKETLEKSFWKSLSIALINNLDLKDTINDLIDCLEVGILSQSDIKKESVIKAIYRIKKGYNEGLENYS